MRKLLLLFSFLVGALSAGSQVSTDPFPKKISVSGSAEMEIIPDQIFVNVLLKEYQKKGETKKELEIIKSEFLAACKATGIEDSLISIVAYSGYNPYWSLKKRKKDLDMFSSIVYQIKFSSSKAMDQLVEKLDDDATQGFDIVRTWHSKMTEYRKQLKIQAVKAAKDKALYLSEAIGETLGNAITVKEPQEKPEGFLTGSNSITPTNGYLLMKVKEEDNYKEVEFKKIKLRFEVEVVYALR